MTEQEETNELMDYWKQYIGFIEKVTEWYQNQSGPFQRFMKYGGWIALQFWIVRAPMTIFLTNAFPETVDLVLLRFPGYVLASFTSGSLLAIVGFFLSEWWIWRAPKDVV